MGAVYRASHPSKTYYSAYGQPCECFAVIRHLSFVIWTGVTYFAEIGNLKKLTECQLFTYGCL